MAPPKEKKMLFLLGGYDLEMVEIKKLLVSKNIKFIDKKLSWGAKLSDYKDELNKYQNYTIYGIELEQDITQPKNYIDIDHHGKNSHMPSSIQQVADILNTQLSREQKLISANDSGYIDGMKKLCASDDEIREIRKRDREAQGITQEDEILAIKSVYASSSNLIFAKTPKFSAISDRIYSQYSQYIVYNNSSLSFYGYNIEMLKKFLSSQNIDEKDYYYGGGNFGFLGLKNGIINFKKIKSLIKEFKKMQKKDEIHSYHIFMLPFIFDKQEDIVKGWSFKPYEDNYNEIAYFHDFFRDSMFAKKEDKNSAFYTKEEYENFEFIICKSKEYKLKIESVNLRVFKTGTGILSFHVKNYNYSEVKDILEINEFGRRIYPEYLDENLKCTLVPNYIQLKDIKEDFKFDEKPKKIVFSKIIQALLPTDKITPAVDDRMFVISFYKNDRFASDLKRDYIKNDQWYKYVFIDADGKTVQNEEMQTELIKKATYPRWQDYGTMYGLSKYSFVCLANSDFALKHMKTIYFQMFSLLLMLRATLLRFSSEVSKIADDIEKKDTAEKVNDLYKRYIQFVNSFYFREITPKEQGLEIYEKAINILNIQRDIKDLDAEIEELHKYVEIQTEKETANKMNTITKIGGILLPSTIITGILGMNTLDGLGKYIWFDKSDSGFWSLVAIALSIVITQIYLKFFNKGET